MEIHLTTLVSCILFAILIPGLTGCGSGTPPSEYFSDAKVIELVNAAKTGDMQTIDRLVAEGVDVNAKGKDDVTALFFALEARNKAGFQRLLEQHADPNMQNSKTGDSVISLAAKIEDDSSWLKLVLEHGGNTEVADMVDSFEFARNKTPIYNAISSRNKKNIELLINTDANLNHQLNSGDSPMMFAASRNWYDTV